MSNKNDNVIFRLKKQVEEKEKAIKAAEKFVPITNCSLLLEGTRFNLHAIGVDDARDLLVRLQCRKMAAESLGILSDYMISGFELTSWIKDIQARLMSINRKSEEEKLRKMKDKLTGLLSEDTRVNLVLKDIAKDLGVESEDIRGE